MAGTYQRQVMRKLNLYSIAELTNLLSGKGSLPWKPDRPVHFLLSGISKFPLRKLPISFYARPNNIASGLSGLPGLPEKHGSNLNLTNAWFDPAFRQQDQRLRQEENASLERDEVYTTEEVVRF